MIQRRPGRRGLLNGIGAVAALGAAGTGIGAWLRSQDAAAHAEAAGESRLGHASGESAMWALVRYATMAANSHNTQPWRFAAYADGLEIRPDFTRRTPAVDPDDHHLFASLGCALENLIQAAPALGLRAEHIPGGAPALRVALDPAPVVAGALFQAIPRRQSTRAPFDGLPLSPSELRVLAEAGSGEGVEVLLITEPARRETLLDLVVAGNAAQMRDAAFMAELLAWIRFSHAEALATRDGLFAGASGSPVVPGALGRLAFPYLFTLGGETDRHVRAIRSSAGVAVFSADRDEPAGWVRAGQAAQRFCLQATALGVRTAWINQPVEVPGLREAFAAWLGIAPRRPDLVLRFGRGPELPPSLRRPVGDVLTGAQQLAGRIAG